MIPALVAGLREDAIEMAAHAMMTTDTRPKEVGVSVEIDGRQIRIGGVAKGSGMIHPNMATMLSFVTTDAAVDPGFLRATLTEVANGSFNMLTVDGDTSTNDTALVLANGLAGNAPIKAGSSDAETFKEALSQVCVHLTRELVGPAALQRRQLSYRHQATSRQRGPR